MNDSASGCRRLAFDAVVVIAPCSNSDVARLLRISFSCAGLPPRRDPLVGVGIVQLQKSQARVRTLGTGREAFERSVLLGLGEALALVLGVVTVGLGSGAQV